MDREDAARVAAERAETKRFYGELYDTDSIDAETFHDLPLVRRAMLADDRPRPASGEERGGLGIAPTPDTVRLVPRTESDYAAMAEMFDRYLEHQFPAGSRTLLLFDPQRTAVDLVPMFSRIDRFALVGDAGDLSTTLELFEDADIDTLYTTPDMAERFGQRLAEAGEADRFDRVVVAGQVPPGQREVLAGTYPSADLSQTYGSVETAFTGYQCSELAGTNSVHPFPDHHFHEIIDPETGEVLPDGETGELVTTTLWTDAGMAFTRYQTGDAATHHTTTCTCNAHHTLKLEGAARLDGLRVRGARLYRERLDDAVRSVRDLTTGAYRVRLEETGDPPLPRLHLDLERRRAFDRPEAVRRTARDRIARALSVSPSHSWADIAGQDIVAPLDVTFHDALPDGRFFVDQRFDGV